MENKALRYKYASTKYTPKNYSLSKYNSVKNKTSNFVPIKKKPLMVDVSTQTNISYLSFLKNHDKILGFFNHEELENEKFYLDDIFDFLSTI